MAKRILIAGAGFAGVWAALGAARVREQAGDNDSSIEIVLIAPEPYLHLRPRFHESELAQMRTPLLPLFEAVGVRYVEGAVEGIDTATRNVAARKPNGETFGLGYDRLVLATGSQLYRPEIPGLREHAQSIDQYDEVRALDEHLRRLAAEPDAAARNTVAIVGGGFTGIEIATALPSRLRELWAIEPNIIVIEQADCIGPELGPGPRPVIEQALDALGITRRLATSVKSIDADGVTTSAGDRIAAKTVIWTAGMRASPLTRTIAAKRDPLGRLEVDGTLHVPGVANIFATGDVALARTDGEGHYALMSCQHALTMGRFAGYNVAADLIGLPLLEYQQPRYGTCLDLGDWGAVYTQGWHREVQSSGSEAKAVKRMINGEVIYPPPPDRAAALAAADPAAILVR